MVTVAAVVGARALGGVLSGTSATGAIFAQETREGERVDMMFFGIASPSDSSAELKRMQDLVLWTTKPKIVVLGAPLIPPGGVDGPWERLTSTERGFEF